MPGMELVYCYYNCMQDKLNPSTLQPPFGCFIFFGVLPSSAQEIQPPTPRLNQDIYLFLSSEAKGWTIAVCQASTLTFAPGFPG